MAPLSWMGERQDQGFPRAGTVVAPCSPGRSEGAPGYHRKLITKIIQDVKSKRSCKTIGGCPWHTETI